MICFKIPGDVDRATNSINKALNHIVPKSDDGVN